MAFRVSLPVLLSVLAFGASAPLAFASTTVVTSADLDPAGNVGPVSPSGVVSDGLNKWFMYNDTNDTVNNTLGSFVAGPGTPPNGTSSVQFTLAANPLNRKNIATYQFSGTPLASITQMSFGVYSHGGSGGAGASESPFLNFNVDFTGTSGAWQSRLVYVPSINRAVAQDTWNNNDAIQGGVAQWVYSGATWPAPNTAPGTTPKTWSQILTDYPNARLLPVGGWLGIRVGEPGPMGYIANVDNFTFGTSAGTTVFDFEQPSTVYVNNTDSTCAGQSPCYSTIQAAVNAVATGGTVNVATGTYTEQVNVDKNLTLTGAGAASTNIAAPASLVADVLGTQTILEIGNNANVTISGLTVAGPGPAGCGSISYGIFVVGGATLNINNSAINNIADSTFSGCQNGGGIRAGSNFLGQVGHLTADHNSISGYQKGGIVVDGPGSTGTITNNTITGAGPTSIIAQNGIQISRGATATVTSNNVSMNSYSGLGHSINDAAAGILIYLSNGVSISANNLHDNELGIELERPYPGTGDIGTNSANISQNSIANNSSYGLYADAVTASASVPATPNWWGNASGPTNATTNPSGIGNSITDNVTFSPWYTDAAMTTLAFTTSTSTATTTATTGSGTTTLTGTSTGTGSVTVTTDIPSGTTVTGDASWDGVIAPPTTTNITPPGNNVTPTSAITVGSALSDLTFNKAVKLTFAGQADTHIGWYDHTGTGTFTEITTDCTGNNDEPTQTANLNPDKDCKISNDGSGNLIVWTRHFSTFVTYTQIAASQSNRAAAVLSSPGSISFAGGGGGTPNPLPGAVATTPAATVVATTPAQGRVLGAAVYNFTKALSVGVRGAEVTAVQQFLTDNNFYTGPITGYFGQLTRTAVIAFQKARGIAGTGTVGPLTRAELNKGTAEATSTTATTTATTGGKKLSAAQVASVVGLLQSFGVDAATIAKVQASLQ